MFRGGWIFRLHIVQFTDSPCCRQGPVYSRWRRSLYCHWYGPHYKCLHEMQPWLRLIKPFTDDLSSLFHGRTTHYCILTAYLNAICNEFWPPLVFNFMWPLHISFAARFSNMPFFRQSLSRNAITKFYQMWCIYRETLPVDACNFSSPQI